MKSDFTKEELKTIKIDGEKLNSIVKQEIDKTKQISDEEIKELEKKSKEMELLLSNELNSNNNINSILKRRKDGGK